MEEMFKRYVTIQFSGIYNMIVDAYKVMDMTKIKSDDYCYIQNHYRSLKTEYPKAYEEGMKAGKEIQEKVYN